MANTASFTAASTIPAKLFCNMDDLLYGIAKNRFIKPVHIQVNPTNKCPLNCSFCSCTNRNKDLELSFEKLKALTDSFISYGTKAVTITGGGDPLAYPHLSDYFQYLSDRKVKIGLVTNGVLYKPTDVHFMSLATWCRISLSDEYSLLTPKLQNIIQMTQIDWSFSYVLMPGTKAENVIAAINFANENALTHVRLVDDILDDKATSLIDHIKMVIKEKGVDDSRVIYQGRKTYTKGMKSCLISLLKPNIGPDGNIYPCCIDENEPVMIERDGNLMNVSIKKVIVGDKCLPYGEIEAIYKKPKETLLEITTQTGRSILVSKDHILLKAEGLTVNGSKNKRSYHKEIEDNYRLIEVKANDVKVDDLLPSKFMVENYEHSPEINATLAEFLGYYVSEGWLSTRYYSTKKGEKSYNSLGLAPGFNAEFLSKIHSCMDRLKAYYPDLTYKNYLRRTTNQIMIYSKELCQLILKYECGTRALNKSLPTPIFNSPNNIKKIFLKAYFDGDGNRQNPSKNYIGHKIVLSTISRHLVSDLILFLSQLEIYATVTHTRRAGEAKIEGRKVHIHDKYSINIAGYSNLEKIALSFNFEPRKGGHVKRRSIFFPKNNDIMFLKIKRIREVEPTGEYLYDIKVKDGNKFCTGIGQIIVHNCGIQYAKNPPALDLRPEDSFGDVSQIKDIWDNQKNYDGSDCEKCYYSDYNNILNIIEGAKDLQHKEFV